MTAEDICRAVRYYEGDVSGEDPQDPFWGDSKAYVTLNALFFDGLRTERLRVREGKRLNPAVLADPQRLADCLRALFLAAEQGRRETAAEGFRVERAEDFAEVLRAGETLAFTSTCRSGYLRQFGDKRGIVLIRFLLPPKTPCIVFSELLPSYAKAAEDELLLPPFLPFTGTERACTGAELEIRDMDGNPPLGVYELRLFSDYAHTEKPSALPLPPADAAEVFAALNAGKEPESPEQYLLWKRRLRTWLLGAL